MGTANTNKSPPSCLRSTQNDLSVGMIAVKPVSHRGAVPFQIDNLMYRLGDCLTLTAAFIWASGLEQENHHQCPKQLIAIALFPRLKAN